MIEVLYASVLALVFCLAVLQALIPANQLEARDADLTRSLELAEGSLEDVQRDSLTRQGYDSLASAPPAYADEEHHYMLRREVETLAGGQKRVTVAVFRAGQPATRPLVQLALVVTRP